MSEDSFDDFMDGIGLDVKPLGPEDALLIRMKAAGCNELHVLRYWLIHEIHHYYHALKNGVIYMRRNNITNELVTFRKEEFIALRIDYYLDMKYLPWFMKDISGLGVAKKSVMVKILLEQELVQDVMTRTQEELPKVTY